MSRTRPPVELIDRDDEDEGDFTAKELKKFKAKLTEARAEVMSKLQRHMGDALEGSGGLVEEVDLANREVEQAYQLKIADKERKLLKEINRALAKFEDGEYGSCEGTGDLIKRKRLELRPWTRYSVAYKEQLERERGRPGRRS